MKVSEALAKESEERLPPLQAHLLAYLEGHDDEVFPYRDPWLPEALGARPAAVDFSLWGLHKRGLISKDTVDRRVVFGCHKAIRALRAGRGIRFHSSTVFRGRRDKMDSFLRARELRDHIFAREGDIDVLELLDSIRGPWE